MAQFIFGTLDVLDVFSFWDQSQSQLGRRPSVLVRSAANKVSVLKSLSAGQNSLVKPRAPQKKYTNGHGIKQSTIGRMPPKGPARQRLHPRMLSIQDRATAHYGAVPGLKVTEDGMYLLSAGSDSRIKLWDLESGYNTFVNFEMVRLQMSKAIQLAISQDSAHVFVACMTVVKAFDVWSGKMSHTFRGHYESANCGWFSSQDQELHTSGSDRQILVWSPCKLITDDMVLVLS